MLQSLDALIAFSTVMLVLSLMITAAVHGLISILGLRGKNLLWGLEELFRRTVPEADRARAKQLANKVLSHATLASTGTRGPSALHLNDVRLVLADLKEAGGVAGIEKGVSEVVASAELNPIVKDLAAKLGEHFPDQEEAVEKAADEVKAKIQNAVSGAEHAAKHFEDWFELTMDAAADKLKLHARWITVAGAVILAFGLRVDAIGIMHQLFQQPELTAEVLAQTAGVQAIAAGRESSAGGRAAVEALEGTLNELKETVSQTGLEIFHPYKGGLAWPRLLPANSQPSLLGCLATVLLLSLGAPFWSGMLSKLLGFRAIVRKRQGEQEPAPAGS